MACSCGSGQTGELWENVKGDGTKSAPGTKAEALASMKVSGGYIVQKK